MRSYKSIALAILSGWVLCMTQTMIAAIETTTEKDQLRLHVVFNNLPHKTGLRTAWGFSCMIEGLAKTVLFDTGSDGDILLSNMEKLGLNADNVEVVVLSHIHGDHTGGLDSLLARNPDVTVFMPESFATSFQQDVKRAGAAIETVAGAQQLFDRVYSTGEMGQTIQEQALIVDTTAGLIVMTGCAHPNVADMAERAGTYLGKNIYLLMGGFHLGGKSDAEISTIINRLKALGVMKVAPSHCTGDQAIGMFRREWKNHFVEGGLGAEIAVPK